ncbi:MAG: hypothetical protein KatS3mg105_3301 [Gemmatales bacterium]|nr:MAG: hypothetical protein KatS3mg105_3301 [Gemmatales bacterium]
MALDFGFRVDSAKSLFFDRKKVIDAVDRATRRNLSKFGAFVRRRARSSIRKRKRGVSSPGNPPFSHTGLLKNFIFFAYQPDRRSVIIGPAKLNKRGDIPHILEFGGNQTVFNRRDNTRMRVFIQARPYMRPAFEKELEKLPSLWANSVR